MKTADQQSNWQTYLLVGDGVQLIAVGLLLEVLLFEGTNIGMSLRWFAVAILLWAVMRSQAWLLLVAFQLSLFFREPNRPQMEHGLGSILYCLVAIGLVTYACGFASLRNELRLTIATWLQWIVEQKPVKQRKIPGLRQDGRPTSGFFIRVFLSILVVLVSIFALMHLPISASGRELLWYRSVNNSMTLWPGPAIIVLAIAAVIFFWQNSWSQMTPPQARLYLRSVFLYYHYRDLKLIVTRMLASAKKNASSK